MTFVEAGRRSLCLTILTFDRNETCDVVGGVCCGVSGVGGKLTALCVDREGSQLRLLIIEPICLLLLLYFSPLIPPEVVLVLIFLRGVVVVVVIVAVVVDAIEAALKKRELLGLPRVCCDRRRGGGGPATFAGFPAGDTEVMFIVV